MKANELRSMTQEELNARLSDLKAELFNLRFQLATGQLENSSRIKTVRREVARIKTIMQEKKALA